MGTIERLRTRGVWLLLLLGACGGEPAPAQLPAAPASTQAALRARSPDGSVVVWASLAGPSVAEIARQAAERTPDEVKARSRRRLAELRQEHARFDAQLAAKGFRPLARVLRVANAIQVQLPARELPLLRALPGVRDVRPVTIAHVSTERALPRLGVPAAWTAFAPQLGAGLRIGIVDSGLDYDHADFGGAGLAAPVNDPAIVEPGSFPTARVFGVDLVGDLYAPAQGVDVPIPDADPQDCTGHGTSVAGIAAGGGVRADGEPFTGPWSQSFEPTDFRVAPGVAPGATLFAIKIFGCSDQTTMILPAMDVAIDPDGDGALDDRLDVVNLSVGGGAGPQEPLEAEAFRALVAAGTVLVTSAGNPPGAARPFFQSAPQGADPAVIQVGATMNAAVLFNSLAVTAPAAAEASIAFRETDPNVSVRLADVGPVSGTLVFADPAIACAELTNAADVAGKVLLVRRGSCPFAEKFARAIAAGAIAIVISDNADIDEPVQIGGGAGGVRPIPGGGVRRADGVALEALLALHGDAVQVTLDATAFHPITLGPDWIGAPSGRGPTIDGSRLKPDLAAPGYLVTAAVAGSGSGGSAQGGTSFSSPFVAGAVALAREVHPSFAPAQVKALLMNAAVPTQNLAGARQPTSLAGAGRLQVDAALAHHVTAAATLPEGAVSLSFGAIVAASPVVREQSFEVQNHGAVTVEYDLVLSPDRELPGVRLELEPAELTVAPGQQATVTLRLSFDPALLGEVPTDAATPALIMGGLVRHALVEPAGIVLLVDRAAGAPESIGLPYHAVVRAGAERAAGPIVRCDLDPADARLLVPITGPSAHAKPVSSAFELLYEADPATFDPIDPRNDVLAVGATTDLAQAAEPTLYVGVVTGGQWSTPAGTGWAELGVFLDRDGDGAEDALIFPQSFNPEPFAGSTLSLPSDIPTLQFLDLQTGEGSWLGRASVLSPDALDTQPFHNGVFVFALPLRALPIAAPGSTLKFAVAAGPFATLADGTGWLTIDVAALALDATRAGHDGTPFFGPDEPLVVHAPAAGGGRLLVMHHTNLEGRRFDLLETSAGVTSEDGNLAVSATAPTEVDSGAPFEVAFVVQNDSASVRRGVRLELTATDVSGTVGATQGSCVEGSCLLGELAPGASATVTFAGVAPNVRVAVDVSLQATLSSALACELDLTDNARLVSVAVVPTGGAGGAGGGGAGGGGGGGGGSGGAGGTGGGAAGSGGAGEGGVGAGGSGAGGAPAADDASEADESGCGCGATSSAGLEAGAFLLAAAALLGRRRR